MHFPIPFNHSTSTQSAVSCTTCARQTQCFAQELDTDVLLSLAENIRQRPLARGTFAYRSGDAFNTLYFIQEGFCKKALIDDAGQECIVGFSMAGDVLGLDGCAEGCYTSQAVALQDSVVCEIPFTSLLALSFTFPSLQQSLHRIMSREIAHNQKSMLLLGSLPAEEKLLAFLYGLAQQFAVRGIAADAFDLPMSREEIAGFLGLQMETVSRAFTKLHAEGLINVQRRHIRIDTARAA